LLVSCSAMLRKQLEGREDPGTARALAAKAHELQLSLEQAERAMSQATASEAAMKLERDAAVTRAREAEETLEAKRQQMADRYVSLPIPRDPFCVGSGYEMGTKASAYRHTRQDMSPSFRR
jgi:septal ring factor EnvC (AmiA/AmiB activator)